MHDKGVLDVISREFDEGLSRREKVGAQE